MKLQNKHFSFRVVFTSLLVVVGAACTPLSTHVHILASDALQGRQNDTAASVASQDYIISQLKSYGATGLETTKTGDDR